MIFNIANEKITARITDIGAELISVCEGDGYEYIWGADGRYWSGHAPLLFPVCGRLLDQKYTYAGKEYGMNIHGFARELPFTVTDKTEGSITLELSSNDETRMVYPFDFTLTARYEVIGKSLSAIFTVKNTGSTTLPYMFGWHPGFNLEGELDIADFSLTFDRDSARIHPLQNGAFVSPESREYGFPECKYKINNSEIAATDTLIFRDCGSRATLSSSHGTRAVTLEWSENLPYFCVWKHPSEDARYICLEPWSNVPSDGERAEELEAKSMMRLTRGHEETFCYKISLE